jgi:ornithine--oxo-acid transaminase
MASLAVLKDERLAENAELLGTVFREGVENIDSPFIKLVRGKGLLNGIVINHPQKDAAGKLCFEMKQNGLLAKSTHGDKIRFAPPLIITKEQIKECIDIIGHSLKVL